MFNPLHKGFHGSRRGGGGRAKGRILILGLQQNKRLRGDEQEIFFEDYRLLSTNIKVDNIPCLIMYT